MIYCSFFLFLPPSLSPSNHPSRTYTRRDGVIHSSLSARVCFSLHAILLTCTSCTTNIARSFFLYMCVCQYAFELIVYVHIWLIYIFFTFFILLLPYIILNIYDNKKRRIEKCEKAHGIKYEEKRKRKFLYNF